MILTMVFCAYCILLFAGSVLAAILGHMVYQTVQDRRRR